DSEADTLAFDTFQTFEIEELMAMGDRIVVPVLLYLFHRMERRLEGQPSLFLIDEAWVALGHPTFRDKIRAWPKVLRKANGPVELSFLGVSGKDDLRRVRECAARYGADWPAHWLNQKGLSHAL